MLHVRGSLIRIVLSEEGASLAGPIGGDRIYRLLKELEGQKAAKGLGETRAKIWMLP